MRLLRVFRPLRTMNKLKGMRRLIDVILLTIEPLGHVFFLACLLFFTFGIIGVQLFQGALTQHCWTNATGQWALASDHRGAQDLYGPPVCGGHYTCASGEVCMTGQRAAAYRAQGWSEAGNPAHGVTGFDHLPQAFLSIFVAITLEACLPVSNPRTSSAS